MGSADNRKNRKRLKCSFESVRHCKIYRFDNLFEAMRCISSLESLCDKMSFTLFCADGIYYLWLCFNSRYRCQILGTVSEFATPVRSNLRHILREHGEIICRGFYELR